MVKHPPRWYAWESKLPNQESGGAIRLNAIGGNEMDSASQFKAVDAIDHATLTAPVRRALGSNTAVIVEWRHERLAYADFNPTSGGLYRFSGTAHDQGAAVSWSLILKIAHAPTGEGAMSVAGRSPSSWNYWKREFLAFHAGLLDELPVGLVAPHCYGASEQEDESAWLWLEEIADSYGPRWAFPQYAVAAHQLGQLNGAFLAGRPLPVHPWLSSGFLRGWVESFGPSIEGLRGALEHPLVQRGYPGTTAGRLARLWSEREQLFAGLGRLPRTLAHLDAMRHNLFVRQSAEGQDQTVAVDWAFVGIESVGVELAVFVTWSALVAGEVASLRALDQIAFSSYLDGLHAAGWNGERRVVRFGYAASAALRMGALLGNYWDVSEMEEPEAFVQRLFNCSVEELMDRVAGALGYVLDLADEARDLLPGIV